MKPHTGYGAVMRPNLCVDSGGHINCLLAYLLSSVYTSLRIGPFQCFQAGDRKRRPNLALVCFLLML